MSLILVILFIQIFSLYKSTIINTITIQLYTLVIAK